MADTIRELIIKDIKTTLETITIANGYDNTIVSVQRFGQEGQTTLNTPYIIIGEGGEESIEGAVERTTKLLTVALSIVTRQDTDVDARPGAELMDSLKADVQKAMMVDHQRAGNALDTTEVGSDELEPEQGQIDLDAVLVYRIMYRHAWNDPKSLN